MHRCRLFCPFLGQFFALCIDEAKVFYNGQILIRILTHVSRVKNSNLAPVVSEDGQGEVAAGAGGDIKEAGDSESSSSKVILKASAVKQFIGTTISFHNHREGPSKTLCLPTCLPL